VGINTMNKLSKASLEWAVKHLKNHGDTDLFPRPFEIDLISKDRQSIVKQLANVDVSQHHWRSYRIAFIPKDEVSFRRACQLNPIDSLLFTALIRKIGKSIEKRRVPVGDSRVFSYRFDPTADGHLYGNRSLWEEFWRRSYAESKSSEFVIVTDISDFYNQIYHHTLEHQLKECGIKGSYYTAITNMVKSLTTLVSRGIPVGPHASHLLAELVLVPVDEYLTSRGYRFCRYVDDFHIFCNSRYEAQAALLDLVKCLDLLGRLTLSSHKTSFKCADEFVELSKRKLSQDPINQAEADMIKAIESYSSSNYETISLDDLGSRHHRAFEKRKIEKVLKAYLKENPVRYIRLRWFLRRLAQVGAPEGIGYITKNLGKFLPAIGEVARYLNSAHLNYPNSLINLGSTLIHGLRKPPVRSNDYLQAVLLNLFYQIGGLDHFATLAKRFGSLGPMAKRKVILAAKSAGAGDWIRSQKDTYDQLDPWCKRALLYSSTTLPQDEKKFWLKALRPKDEGDPLASSIVNRVKR
jgi:hypothetical protein